MAMNIISREEFERALKRDGSLKEIETFLNTFRQYQGGCIGVDVSELMKIAFRQWKSQQSRGE